MHIYWIMNENAITGTIINCCYNIHKDLGPGLFESVYEEILTYELISKNLKVDRQIGMPVEWKEIRMDQGFRLDLIVENKVIVEIKSIEAIAPVHKKQLITYLRLTNIKVGLLINFNETLLKDGITRLVNNF